MKIKVCIVTYKKNDVLNTNLASLWKTCRQPENLTVTVISNHPDVEIYPENQRDNLKTIFNATRPLNSWGYLARDWNFGILDSFVNWKNPNQTDWCVLAQNDVEWVDGWDDYLRSNTEYDFISQPRGDQSLALNIQAARAIGFFDERFCTLQFQEFDYFYRAILRLGKRASINDDHPGSDGKPSERGLHCPVGCVLTKSAHGFQEEQASDLHNIKFFGPMLNLFFAKWGVRELDAVLDIASVPERYGYPDFSQPREINWYPFFWEGYEAGMHDFIGDYFPPPPPPDRRFIPRLRRRLIRMLE